MYIEIEREIVMKKYKNWGIDMGGLSMTDPEKYRKINYVLTDKGITKKDLLDKETVPLEYTPFLAYTVIFRSFARVFQMYRPPTDCEVPAIRVIPRVLSTNRYNLLASFLPLYRESTSTRSTCQAPFLLLKPIYATVR